MSLQLLIVHTGQRIAADHASFPTIDSLKAHVAQEVGIPTGKQILLASSGKQVKVQTFADEPEIFVYSKDVFSKSSDVGKKKPCLVPEHDAAAHEPTSAPDTLANQDDLEAWQNLFKARRKWALDLVADARTLSQAGADHFDALTIVERGIGVAVGNLEAHIQLLEQRHNRVQDWASDLCSQQEEILEQLGDTRSDLDALPADSSFQRLLPLLPHSDAEPPLAQPSATTLSSFVDFDELDRISLQVRHGLDELKDRAASITSRVDTVFSAAGDLFDKVEKSQSDSVSGLQRDAAQLLEEIEVIANKISSDCEHVVALQPGQRSTSQSSKMALLHTRDYLPSLRDYFMEMNTLVQQTVLQRNAAATRVIANMHKVAEVEGLFANADTQVKELTFPMDDQNALDIVNLVVQLPSTYGSLLLEAIRRLEWTQRIRSESSAIFDDLAGYQEEERRRQKRWYKTVAGFINEDLQDADAPPFEISVQSQHSNWPEVDRTSLLDYVAALKRLPSQADVVRELESGVDDLSRPTKQQSKKARSFKNGSFHDAQLETGSFLLRNNDEIKVLRDTNQKLEHEIKGQRSRVRKLEDLLYRQSQNGRPGSAHSFHVTDGAFRDLPTGDPYPPNLDFEEQLSRKASTNSRRTSGTGSTEEKALAKRIVLLEADLHTQKQRNDELEKRAQGRRRTDSHMRSQLQETESTKRDLMANLEAVQREFATERRVLEDEIEKHKTRNEEVEDELDRILGSRDTEIGIEEKLRSLESDLEHTKAALKNRDRDIKQLQDAQTDYAGVLRDVQTSLGAETPSDAVSFADLLHQLEDVAEKSNRQHQELLNLVAVTRSEKEELQTLLDRKERESTSTRESIQGLEEETARLREEKDASKATATSLDSELTDAREQLRKLRAKFADGETGSEVLQQRLTEQANRAGTLATELAQAKSHVNSLDVELSNLQRRHNSLVTSNESTVHLLETRSTKARELSKRVVACYHDLIRLTGSLGLSIYQRDERVLIQRPSKTISASTSTLETANSVSGSSMLPSMQNFDSTIDTMLTSWMHSSSPDEEAQRFNDLLTKIDRFSLTTFSEAVIKLRRDVEWTGKKWKMEARSYRDKYHRAQAEAQDKIAFRSFREGDLALFLPTRNQATRPWAAFNVGAPHFFLREQDSHKLKSKEWLVARISKIEERTVDLSKTMNSSLRGDRGSNADKASESNLSFDDDNPFELSDGLRWYLLDATEEKLVAPSTPSVGKSTVASATHHAKGISAEKKSSKNDASAKLQSLDSRRSSSNSKRGSISGGSVHRKESNEEVIAGGRSPTLFQRNDGATTEAPTIKEHSSNRIAHRNAPSRSSGLGIEVKGAAGDGQGPTADEVRRDLLWGP